MPRAKMSELELSEWRDRLEHANEVWREKGLIGDEPYSAGNESLQRILEYYRGVHWDYDWGRLDEGERATVNSIFDTANTMLAQISARAPRVQLFPESEGAARFVRPAQELLNYYVKELDMKRQANAAIRESLFAPLGVVRHGYTPEPDFFDKDGNRIHSYRGMKHDVPWIQHVHIWDFRADCTKSSFHPSESDWCAFRTLMTKEQIQSTEGMRWPKDGVSPTVSIQADKLRPRELKSLQDDDFTSRIEVWSIYDSREEKWFQWSPGAPDTLVRDPAEWPLPWDELPYDCIGINEQGDDPFPRPYMAEVAPIHRERNRIRTMMSRLTRDLRRLVPVNVGMLDDGMQARLFDGIGPDLLEFIKIKGPANEAVGSIQIGGFPQELLAYDRQLEEDIRQLTGQSRMDRAQRINVETATEASGVQFGSDTSKGRNQGAVEDFWKGIIRKFGQGLQATMDAEKVIPIVGAEDAQMLASLQGAGGGDAFLRVSPDAIGEDYLFEIAVGSTLPRNQGEEQRKALAWLEVAKQFPQNADIQTALVNIARAFDLDPSKALIDQQTRDAMNKMTAQQGGESGEGQQSLSPLIAMQGRA